MTRAVPNIFAPLTSPSLPNLDTNFLVGANSTVVPCTATGTNAVVLTPFASTYTVSAYTDLELYSFDAPASSTGVMTVQVSSNSVLKLFRNGGSTQATTGDIISGGYCLIAYQASLDSAAGGFVIVYSSGGASSNPARSYLAGLTLSNDAGTPTTKLDVAAGVATDSTNAVLMSSAAGTTIDCTTIGANGFDVGTLGVSLWYHVYLIAKTDGTTAGLVSLQAATPSPMPTGYVYKRRIGSFKSNGSSQITAFVQTGDKFEWKAPVLDVNASTPTSGTQNTITVTVPTGVVVEAIVSGAAAYASGAASLLLVYSTNLTSAPALGIISAVASNSAEGAYWRVTTNSSAQINTKLTYGGSTTYSLETLGWIDRRGRDA